MQTRVVPQDCPNVKSLVGSNRVAVIQADVLMLEPSGLLAHCQVITTLLQHLALPSWA